MGKRSEKRPRVWKRCTEKDQTKILVHNACKLGGFFTIHTTDKNPENSLHP